ncbi:thiol peroxidase [Marinomonas algicola]|uniref:thiol peroxidase n=1 Tax=Marinomonas algicola TaxID=2773454 RepID=UPI00174915CB|nr:thiol peroxidase [Marinomonas algicola]
MTTVTLKGNAFETIAELPAIGSKAPAFDLVKADLSSTTLSDFSGKKIVLNIFPSIDTPTCATSVRKFNQQAVSLDGVGVVCVSADLPFAIGRFCGAEGIENVVAASSFRSSFGVDYGINFVTGPLTGLLSRSIVVIDANGIVTYTEQVSETADEPNYDAVLAHLA